MGRNLPHTGLGGDALNRIAYVVEQPAFAERVVNGEVVKTRVGTARFWTQNKQKAIDEAAKRPDLGRTWREVPWNEVPEAQRELFENAQREATTQP